MISDLKGRWFRSRSMPYVAGSPLDVDLNFLEPARHFAAPEVAKIVIQFEATVTAGAGTWQGEDCAKIYDKITLSDAAEMVNVSGAMLRLHEQVELGSKSVDPADQATTVVATVKYPLHIMFEPLPTRALRPRDFRVPLANFLEAGNLTIQLAAAVPTNMGNVAADWKIKVFFKIFDGRKREAKSRRHIWEQNVQQQEYYYPVNGAIRSAILGSKLTTTGYSSYAGYTTIYSKTLDFPPNFETSILLDEYRMSHEAVGTNDEALLAAPGMLPLVFPDRRQKIGAMIDTPQLHIDLLAAAPASGRLLIDAVVNREPNMAATALGYASPDDVASAIASHGRIVGESGNHVATTFPKPLARKLPIRIDK